VPVEIANHGGSTVQDVRVKLAQSGASNETDETVDVEVVVAFLAAGDTTEAVVAFPRQPAQAGIRVAAITYVNP
jgi:uncharacterized protein (TIGR02588 family)